MKVLEKAVLGLFVFGEACLVIALIGAIVVGVM